MHLVKSLALLVLPSAMAMSGPILGFGFRDDECRNPVGPIESGECFRTEYIDSYALHVPSEFAATNAKANIVRSLSTLAATQPIYRESLFRSSVSHSISSH
ncbi:hypothetical protein BDV36DRAFT_290763 [Aspergillus pseudocaelatus]|uniref:Uncharacterized protein n=1 Tax=Aspergillus pseudocaelatus TaxID=1825620 RepID=A0ABQ6X0T7_9EURO|nr:hypothetical protein BDV36DRAFT_290763 [Aspergillus pseudocaelatus]